MRGHPFGKCPLTFTEGCSLPLSNFIIGSVVPAAEAPGVVVPAPASAVAAKTRAKNFTTEDQTTISMKSERRIRNLRRKCCAQYVGSSQK